MSTTNLSTPTADIDLDWLAVDCLARRRKDRTEARGNHRAAYGTDDLEADRVGAAAEAAFAAAYDLDPPVLGAITGDEGYDFRVRWNDDPTTIEVKGSKHRDPSLLLNDEYRKGADRYVLVSIDWQSAARLIGTIPASAVDDRGYHDPATFGESVTAVDAAALDSLPPTDAVDPIPETPTDE